MSHHGSLVSLSQRSTRLQITDRIDLPMLRKRLMRGDSVEADFTLVAAPVSPRNETSFLVATDGHDLVVLAKLIECKRQVAPWGGKPQEAYNGHIEILFGPRCDDLGYCQWILSPGGTMGTYDFSPYPEARSSQWRLPQIKEWGFDCQREELERGHLIHWAWARFDLNEIFQHGDVVGFNLCRYDGAHLESSAWNFLAGNGAPDAQSLGRLIRRKEIAVDPPRVPAFARPDQFLISMTNDVPDTLIPNPYTPEGLDAEMRALRSWGVGRVHWIIYEEMPAFFAWPRWREHYLQTFKACPDLTRSGVEAAHAHGLEFVADFKLFDLGSSILSCDPSLPGVLKNCDGSHFGGIPEMVGHEEAFMQSNPAWKRKFCFPIKRLRLFSRNPIPEVAASQVSLFVSDDNVRYRQISMEDCRVNVREQERENLGWTPAGARPECGTFRQWMLGIDGLNVESPFLKIEWTRKDVEFENYPYLFIEAVDANGDSAPVELSQRPGFEGDGFLFAPDWLGWVPHADWVLTSRKWTSLPLGIAFHDAETHTGALEPVHPVSQRIWLNRIESLIKKGIDGLSLRLLCHHNNATSWIKFAYSPVVLKAFEERHGRAPEWSEDDLREIRKIRGDAITAVLRKTRELCNARNCKVIFQVETGSEMPAEIGNLMQIHFDYEGWLSERLIDELYVRAITSQCRWVREFLLPLAKKHGVAVHLVSRNLTNGLELQAAAIFDRIVRDAVDAGFDGFNFYESVGLYDINQENQIAPRGLSKPVIQHACHLSRSLCGSGGDAPV